MSQGVTNGQLANQNTFNQGFMSRKDDTDTIGKVDLLNFSTDSLSGTDIVNVQKNINALASALGISPNQAASLVITWASSVVGSSTSSVVAKVEALVAKFDNSTGHAHDGTQGNGKQISALTLSNLNTLEAQWQKVFKGSVSGTTVNLSTEFSGKTPGGTSSQVGVITAAPDNKCFIVDNSNGTLVTDPADGLTVYGRIDSGFILSFYKLISGVETAYSLPSTNLDILFLEVFTIGTRPTIPQFPALYGNLDTTNDVVDATATTPGKVSIVAQTFAGAKTFNDNLKFIASLYGDSETDSTTTGTGATMPTPTKFVRRVTNASLVSISIITAPTESQIFTLINKTGAAITISDLNVATGNIRTGTGVDATIAIDGSMLFVYNKTDNRWHVAGGTSAPSANRTLSNLTAPTAINVDALPATDNARTFGSTILRWLRIYVSKISSASGDQIDIGVRALLFDTSTTIMSWFNNGIQLAASRVLRFTDGAGTKTIEFNPPATATANQSYTLPLDVPAVDNYALKSTIAGVMSWGPASASGGVVNLIANGNADDTSASIFVPYQDTSGSRPADGTGGTTTGITTSITSTNPLVGTKSYLLSKDAAIRQGGGWAIPFTVDPAYRAKSLKISVDYIINSGTFLAGSSTADSDIIWYIYDVTNSQLIEPSNIKMFSNSSTLSDKFEGTFQTSPTGSSYRLIAHIATISASAYDIKVDTITVTPQNYIYGTPVTDWVAYTPTITGHGTPTGVSFYSRRVGQNLEVVGGFTSGTTTAVNSQITIGFNGGNANVTYDAAKLYSAGYGVVGQMSYNQAAAASYQVIANNVNQNFVNLGVQNAGGTAMNPSQQIPGTGGSATFRFTVPIVGWGSSVSMSTDSDSRVLVAIASIAAAASTTSAQPINFSTVMEDTHGGITTGASWKYTASSFGYLRIGGNVDAGTATHYQVYKNNVSQGYVFFGGTSQFGSGYRVIKMNAGDFIDLRPDTGGTIQATSYITIEKVPGPQAIAAAEKIRASYVSSTGQSIANATNVTFVCPTKLFDTHGVMNTSTGVITVPRAGFGQIKSACTFNAFAGVTTSIMYMVVLKNGVAYKYGVYGLFPSTVSTNWAPGQIAIDVDGVAGDTFQVAIFQNTGAAKTLQTVSQQNYIDFIWE